MEGGADDGAEGGPDAVPSEQDSVPESAASKEEMILCSPFASDLDFSSTSAGSSGSEVGRAGEGDLVVILLRLGVLGFLGGELAFDFRRMAMKMRDFGRRKFISPRFV